MFTFHHSSRRNKPIHEVGTLREHCKNLYSKYFSKISYSCFSNRTIHIIILLLHQDPYLKKRKMD